MPAAVRHGGYRTDLLPGENAADFEKLHRDLIGELSPTGPFEEDIVCTIVRIIWRKNHMGIVRAAQRAWDSYDRIESRQRSEMVSELRGLSVVHTRSVCAEFPLQQRKELREAVEEEAREELGDDYKFIEAGKDATANAVMENFEVESRLDAMLDACMKRLLHLRGFKSLSSPTSSARLLARPDGDKAA